MVEKKRTKMNVISKVTREQASREAEVMMNKSKRSRWITVVVAIFLLAIGAFIIGKRISPYALGDLNMASGSYGDYGQAIPRNDVPMVDEMYSEKMPESVPSPVLAKVKGLSLQNTPPNGVDTIDRKVVKNGFVDIIVGDIAWATRELRNIAQSNDGDISSSNFMTDIRERVRGTVVLRVPVTKFDDVFAAIKDNVALTVNNENMNAQDVTAQFVDLEAQLKNKKREEESIAKILEKSGKISEVLSVTRELSRVRGEIERLEGSLRYLSARTDYSVITITLQEDEKIVSPEIGWRPAVVAKQSLNRLMADAQQFIDNTIRFSVWFVPMFIVYIVIIVILWKIVKKIGSAFVRRLEKKQNK